MKPHRITSGTRLARNATLHFLTEIGIFLILLFAMPRVVHAIGTTLFGLFMLAWVILNYLSFFDVGVGSATTKFLAEHLLRGELEKGATLVRTSAAINFLLGAGTGLVLFAMAPFLVRHTFKIPSEMEHEAIRMFSFVAIAIPALLVQAVCRSVVFAMQRFGWNSSIRLGAQALQWGLILFAALRGFHISSIVAMAVLARASSVVAYFALIARIFPETFVRVHADFGLWRKLLSFGGWVTISQLATPILVYLDRVLLASFAGLAAVALYSVPFEGVTRLRILPASMVATLFPAFSERAAHSGGNAVARLYSEAVRYLALLLLPCFGFLIVFGPEVLRLWMGEQFAAQAGLIMRLVAFGALLNAFAYIPRVALQGTGRPDLTAKIYLIEVPVYLAACVFLIHRFGVVGAAWAAIFRFGLDSALLYGAANRFTHCTLRSVWERGIVPVAFSALALNLGFMTVRRLPGSHIVHLTEAAALAAAYLPLAWWFVLDDRDKPFILRVAKFVTSEQGKVAAQN